MSILLFAALLVVQAVPLAIAQTPPPVNIPPSAPDEITVELPKAGPTMVAPEEGPAAAVIPAGQEELFADMLGRGAALPGGCTLSGGQIDGPTVRATYNCPAGDVVFELVHPDQAGFGATKTERFGIVLKSGSAPDGFVADVAGRIRSREGTFEWKWLGAPPARRSFRPIVLAAGAGVLAIVAGIWILRARRSR